MEQRVLVVIGTRPEAIKLAPVIKRLAAARPEVQPVICVTGQHREMVDDVLRLFEIAPDYDLDIMKQHQTASGVFAAVLERIEPVLRQVRPQLALVQGDTTTAVASALAAFHERVPVGHVEAGLRTDNIYDPFPEELNRRLVTQLTTLHFAATGRAADRLIADGVTPDRVHLTGNPVVDAVHWIRSSHRRGRTPCNPPTRSILVTAHRRENLGAPLERICTALQMLVAEHRDVEIVYPVHPNPLVTGPVRAALGTTPRIRLLPPVSYPELLRYMDEAYLVLTDSGGLQEEATVLGKPVLIMRETTERQEAIEAGAAELVGTDPTTITRRVGTLLRDPDAYSVMATPRALFGDGHAAERIVRVIEQFLATNESAALASAPMVPSVATPA
ncbi:MAG TPA: UDP-N-acetylglucosamine 2-epimerase (non-hydrolyzing) [Candidatus Limnocylindria bacterium]|nr:UDP-N-acetylglucosamine 2-epimerase (non-hydrolyzing) [Candidatus Limnocylindria bacterium]